MSEPLDLPGFSVKTLRRTMDAAFESVRIRIEMRLERRGIDDLYWRFGHALLLSAQQTFEAALFLVSDDRRYPSGEPRQYPGQALILVRSILEALANFQCLSEDRVGRARLYACDGYRERYNKLPVLRRLHGNEAKWQRFLQRERRFIDNFVRWFNLTEEEAKRPKMLRWPKLNDIVTGFELQDADGATPWLSSTRKASLSLLYRDYSASSRVAHQKDDALYFALRVARRPPMAEAEVLRNQPAFQAFLYAICILTEAESEGSWGTGPQRELREGWALLVPQFDPARDVWQLRYSTLLES